MGKGSNGTQTTTQTTEAPDYLKPYLLGTPGVAAVPGTPATEGHYEYDDVEGMQRWIEGTPATPGQAAIPETPGLYSMATDWFNSQNPQYYQGNTVAPTSSDTQSSWDMARNLALNNPTLNTANTQLQNTMEGDYLNSNPYLDATFNRAAQNVGREYSNIVTPQIASRFGTSGMGSSALEGEMYGQAQTNLGNTLGNLATDIYGGNYAKERDRQMQSLLFSPTMNQANFQSIGQLGTIGQQQQQQSQDVINADINKWNFGQNLPYNKLNQYSSLLFGGPNYGSTTSTQPVYGNPFGGMIGGGMAGAGLAGQLGLLGGAGAAASPWAWPLIGLGAFGGMQ